MEGGAAVNGGGSSWCRRLDHVVDVALGQPEQCSGVRDVIARSAQSVEACRRPDGEMSALRRATRSGSAVPPVGVASFEQSLECVALHGSVEPLEDGACADPPA